MSYSKVGTPRFYINLIEWLGVNKRSKNSKYKLKFFDSTLEELGEFPDIFRTYPKEPTDVEFIGVDLVQQEVFYVPQSVLWRRFDSHDTD